MESSNNRFALLCLTGRKGRFLEFLTGNPGSLESRMRHGALWEFRVHQCDPHAKINKRYNLPPFFSIQVSGNILFLFEKMVPIINVYTISKNFTFVQ